MIVFRVISVCMILLCIWGGMISHAHAKYRHFYRAGEACITPPVNAFTLAEQVAHGYVSTKDYELILYDGEMEEDLYGIMPHHLAYGLYTIAWRIGVAEAKSKQQWLSSYISSLEQDKIAATIYRKYSRDYLLACFSGAVAATAPAVTDNTPDTKKKSSSNAIQDLHDDVYPLYFDNE